LVEAQYGQGDMQIGFNADYVLDFLRAAGASSSIRIQLKDAESAAEFRPSGEDSQHYRYVLMPVRS